MCGIAGIVSARDAAPVEAPQIRAMCNTLIHRGPDEEGLRVDGHVGLGMRRLSIIDLAGGHQPIHNEDHSVWVVFNGEIYNFLDLRPELERRGHCFYTGTDTEVIVHLYEELGPESVQKLRGMFAFALYDGRRRSLLLARDRLGKKPLHYAFSQGRLLFASEIKAILAVAPELKETNPEALLQYFYFGYIPDPQTAFLRIHKLPPGHLLEFSGGQAQVRQYWDLPVFGTDQPRSEEECLEELERRLEEAVRIRLISDVPLGALLSGGTDSSTVVALMARSSSKPVKTFSIGFHNRDFNEAAFARSVAERFGTDHHELFVEPVVSGTLEALTRTLEEPFADDSIVPTYYVSLIARQHVTVALSGDGGDELFAGYERYPINLRRRIFDLIPSWAKRWYREQVFHRLPTGFYGRNWLFNVSLPARDRYLDYISLLPVSDRARSLFSGEFLASAGDSLRQISAFRAYYDHAPASDLLSRLQYVDTKTNLAAGILTKVDRMSMAASLEVRSPLLDHVLLEWVTGLPANLKYSRGQQKYILRKLAERLGVPRDVLERRKQGFAMPLMPWMRRELKDDLARLLLEPRSLQRGYFNRQMLGGLLDEHFRGRRDHSEKIWALLMFELWHRNFLEAPRLAESETPPVPALGEMDISQGKGRSVTFNSSLRAD